ncbi:MAG: hypothetical protein HYV07_32575 [Deltaproteobacteria bacterium]|nr:hypothetical protein [Deltaproteobacteria bacterium]
MKTTVVRTKVERFLPYRYAKSGLLLEVLRARVDGEEVGLDPDARLVDLSPMGFRTLTLSLRVSLAPEVVAAVFPPEERESPPGRVAVCVRCDPTRFRSSAFAPESTSILSHDLSLVVPRDDLKGSVELTPFLVRASRGVSGEYASIRGERLASGRSWTVRIDRERSSTGQFIDVRFEDFAQLPGVSDDIVYYLELEQPNPILWLNSKHRAVVEVMMSRATRGARASIRELVFDMIESSVWSQLFLRASMDLARAGETGYAWEDRVLAKWLPKLFPETEDEETRRALLKEEIDRGELPSLLRMLDMRIQDESSLATHLSKLAEPAE